MGRSLSFDFCDYGATINDYRATIDFATISDFGDFRTAGGDPDGGWMLDVSMEISRGSTFVAVSGPGCAAFPLRRRVVRLEIGAI